MVLFGMQVCHTIIPASPLTSDFSLGLGKALRSNVQEYKQQGASVELLTPMRMFLNRVVVQEVAARVEVGDSGVVRLA